MKSWTMLLVGLLSVGIILSAGCELERTLGLEDDDDHDSSTGEFGTTATIKSFHDPRPNEQSIYQIWVMDDGKDLAITEKTVFWVEAPSCSSRFIGTMQEFNRGDIIEYRWNKDDLVVGTFGARVYPTDVIRLCDNYPKDPVEEEEEVEVCPCCGEPCTNPCGCEPDCGCP